VHIDGLQPSAHCTHTRTHTHTHTHTQRESRGEFISVYAARRTPAICTLHARTQCMTMCMLVSLLILLYTHHYCIHVYNTGQPCSNAVEAMTFLEGQQREKRHRRQRTLELQIAQIMRRCNHMYIVCNRSHLLYRYSRMPQH